MFRITLLQNFRLNGELYDAVSIAEDDQWRRIRSVLSPSFTSGRLKEMFSIMKHHSANLLGSMKKKADKDEPLEMKEFFGPYSMDVVTSTAFSVDIDSLNNPSDPFVTNIKKMLKFDLFNLSSSLLGPVEYQALMEMEYLDGVINESLRLYPIAPRLERVAKATVEINGLVIPKDMVVMVPTWTFTGTLICGPSQRSSNLRGPRNCIGMRFALVMMRLALVEILQRYSFSVCKETEIPLEMDIQGLLMPKRPIQLKLEARS
ncbi:hypothetical protein F7725_005751 [Dissostichus mawsoni]|uniref:Cytochrome P450 3A n=1 Tax=Dissostichus mawsoni TaxID=36200 RepID=A0A7J5YSD0_DISMA|nr:hypothetical protein F7725_005751 [Dissostichus mawsoni]